MRQLTVLIVGLMLIFGWAALVRTLRTAGKAAQTTAHRDASHEQRVTSPVGSNPEPPRMPGKSQATRLTTTAVAPLRDNSHSFHPQHSAGKHVVAQDRGVVAASFMQQADIGKLASITDSAGIGWNAQSIEQHRNAIYISGSTPVDNFTTEPSDFKIVGATGEPFTATTNGSTEIAVVNNTLDGRDATNAFQTAKQSGRTYTIYTAQSSNAADDTVFQVGLGDSPLINFDANETYAVAQSNNRQSIRLLMTRDRSRRFLVQQPAAGTQVVTAIQRTYSGNLIGDLVEYYLPLDANTLATYKIFSIREDSADLKHSSPVKIATKSTAGTAASIEFAYAVPHRQSGNGINVTPNTLPDGLKNTFLEVKHVASDQVKRALTKDDNEPLQFDFELPEGSHTLSAQLFSGTRPLGERVHYEFSVVNSFKVVNFGPTGFGTFASGQKVTVQLNRPPKSELPDNSVTLNSTVPGVTVADVAADQSTIVITLAGEIQRGEYNFVLNGNLIQDQYGNNLQGNDGVAGHNYLFSLGSPSELGQQPLRGIAGRQAERVEYPQFLTSQQNSSDFNPNDRVETRVSRLYFYRDAHRVAQIINRMVDSYNSQGVSASQTLARQARKTAEKSASDRMAAERQAIRDAEQTRKIQRDLAQAQSSLDTSLRQLEQASLQLNRARETVRTETDPTKRAAAQNIVTQNETLVAQYEAAARRFDTQINDYQLALQGLQTQEAESREEMLRLQQKEELDRVEQFRLEAALGHADPDTYAPGKLESIDPVAQVSITVIGEGLLHLRGPLKGLNKVRMMIDQIDAPQGQVAVKVHSAQINGDEADHLEVVANRIQTYIDQARFMTTQTAEMLRKSVVTVAAQRAEQARALYPGTMQEDRDRRYLDAFFGADFIQELDACDSELLRTGNKLLSLHSMDVTSLSHALLLISLAKNSTRLEILQEFQRRLAEELPIAEAEYIRNGIGCCTGGCKQGCKHHNAAPPICSLSQNASFTSLRGFFDTQLAFDDTMTPMQREVIKLAQILRARLLSENELKQRINDRSVVESRFNQSGQQEKFRQELEQRAREELRHAQESHQKAQAELGASIPQVTGELQRFRDGIDGLQPTIDSLTKLIRRVILPNLAQANDVDSPLTRIESALGYLKTYESYRKQEFANLSKGERVIWDASKHVQGASEPVYLLAYKPKDYLEGSNPDANIFLVGDRSKGEAAAALIQRLVRSVNSLTDNVALSQTTQEEVSEIGQSIKENREEVARVSMVLSEDRAIELPEGMAPLISLEHMELILSRMVELLTRYEDDLKSIQTMQLAKQELTDAFSCLTENTRQGVLDLDDIGKLFDAWNAFDQNLKRAYNQQPPVWVVEPLKKIQSSLVELSSAFSRVDSARAMAAQAKAPLDHKKFLDMFIDEEEEQLIELLEGTRAHTANIDNYLKRITTALDDDFNRQFYRPSLRLIRTASQYKRVEFGQTEETGVLANNRAFAKVHPSATMEFDLPKRDILLKEAVDGILATYNDVGALLNDPNFLALVKMQAGGAAGGVGSGAYGVVQNVLPGLQSDSTEQVISRHSGASPGFGSELEKLMKDPAIYKFETGTGYEIRPVIAPDGQAVVFDFHYLYTTQIREPVRADAKHLGRVKRHLIDTDVQLSNFELREVSRYTVALKAERTARGVPLLEDIPVVGVLWRPLPSREKSLQQNIIMAQATIFPTLFDLMNLRWAPEVAELDPLAMSEREFVRDNRNRQIKSYIDGVTKSYVDDSLGIPQNARRQDLYSPQATLPRKHPSGYSGPGTHYRYAPMQEGHQTGAPTANDIPWRSSEGSRNRPPRPVFPVMPGAAPQDGISGAVPGTGFAPEASFIPAQPGPIPAQMQNTPLGSNAPTTIQQPESIRARPTPRVSQPTIEELPSPRAGPQQVGQAAIVREAPILHSSSGITTSPPIDASRQIDTSRQNAEWQPARREYPK